MVDWNQLNLVRVTSKTFGLVDKASSQNELRRDPGGGVLWSTGRFVLNVNGSDWWEAVVRATPEVKDGNYVARGGGDETKMLIAVYPDVPGTAGATAVRLTPRRNASGQFNVTLNVLDVLQKYPALRFTGKRKVTVIGDRDSAGRAYLEIQLQSQLATRTVPRKKKSGAGKKDEPLKKDPPPVTPDLETEDELDAESEEE